MQEEPFHIKFRNLRNPRSDFDLLQLENLFRRKDLDHSLEELHVVDFYMLIFIWEGKGMHKIDFTDYPCKKGTLFTIRKDQIHRFYKNDQIQGTLLLFKEEFIISYLEKLEAQKTLQLFNELLGDPKLQLGETEFEEIAAHIERIKQEYQRINDAYSLGIIRSELHILVTKLYRIKSQDDQLIPEKKYLSDFIRFQNLVEKQVKRTTRVKEYAQMLGVSTKTLNAISKSIVNKTAKEFIDEICIKQIKRLLINTSLSIKEIAYDTGFEETTNFYKYFKRRVDMTPEQFRVTH